MVNGLLVVAILALGISAWSVFSVQARQLPALDTALLSQPVQVRTTSGVNTNLAPQATLLPAASGTLSQAEIAALKFMREEEKLAYDVYLAMVEIWSLPQFQNIATSEQTHMDAVKALLERYDVPDPASKEAGKFTDPQLQVLYNQLIEHGNESLAEALKVGAEIEEIDILDIKQRLAGTDKADIQFTFTNLLRGSTNHLNAFVRSLATQTGETYAPQHMNEGDYQAILSGSPVSGGRSANGSSGFRRGANPVGGNQRGYGRIVRP